MNALLSSITNTYTRFKKPIIALLLFVFVFVLLGIPFTQWWFYGADDTHALFLGYKTKTWHDLFYFFYDGHTNQGQNGPSNYLANTERTSFLTTYYRPLCLISYVLHYWFFGTSGYAFHLTNVFVHALNTALLFIIFRWFIATPWAGLVALLFTFHPQIAFRFGAFVNLQYYISLTCTLSICLLFKKYLDTQKTIFLLLANSVYIFALFLRESAIVLPGIITLATCLYQNTYPWQALRKTWSFFMIATSFLLLRLWLYPFNFNAAKGNVTSTFADLLTKKIPEIQVFMYDLFHMSWLPWGRPWLRGTIMVTLMSCTLLLFIKNTHKLYLATLSLMFMALLWPCLLGPYSPRYFYEIHPFILITFIALFLWQKINWQQWHKYAGMILLSASVFFQATFCFINFAKREEKMQILHDAVYEVINNTDVQTTNRPLCFIGHPFDGFAFQNAQIFWVLLNNSKRHIYFDSATAIICPQANLVTSRPWGMVISSYPTHDDYTITPVPEGFIVTSNDPGQTQFILNDQGYSLGTKIILKNTSKIFSFLLKINKAYLQKNPIFFNWSFALKQFKQINFSYKLTTDKT